MVSRSLVLALVLVVLTAGCTGDGGGAAPTTTATGGSNDDGTTTVGNAGSDDGDGDADSSDAMDAAGLTAAEAALRDAGSFTATWSFSGTDESGVSSGVGYTYAADVTGDRAYVVFSASGDDQPAAMGWEQYSAGGMTYMFMGSEAGTFYQAEESDLDVVGDAVSWAGLYAYDDYDGFAFVGTEQFDGVTVRRYELSDLQSAFWAANAGQTDADSDLEVVEFDYVVLVDENGLSRFESWSYTGRTASGQEVGGQWEYSLTGIGTTDVPEPEWLTDAQAQG